MAIPDFAGRTVVVTGGAGGIGGAISRRFAAAGATVVLNDIDEKLLSAMVADIESCEGSVVPVLGDVTDPRTVGAIAAAAGDASILVNNVGDYRPSSRSFASSTEEQWQALYAVNLEHVFRVTHSLLPALKLHGNGSIVNVSTVEAFRGIPGNAVYSAFNAGIVAFTRSLAVEVAASGIRVNAIAPDLADTLQTPAASMLRGRDPDMVKSWVPVGRFGQPEDYAHVVLFLAGDGARFVTGQTIPVDGGTLAASGWYRKADGRGFTNLPDQP